MQKFLLYCLVFIFFGLSTWQVFRFFSKRQDFIFFAEENLSLKDEPRLFGEREKEYFYFWKNKQLKTNLDLEDDEIEQVDQDIETLESGNQCFDISVNSLYRYHTVCGNYLYNKAFAIYNPKNFHGISKNGYSIILPLLFHEQILLVKYFWNESLDKVKEELEQLDNSDHKIIIASKKIKIVNFCFDGIIVELERYLTGKMSSFLFENDLKNAVWVNLNGEDLIKQFGTSNSISNYMIDTTIDDLSKFQKNYKHHIFYAIMWFLMGIFGIYYIRRRNKYCGE